MRCRVDWGRRLGGGRISSGARFLAMALTRRHLVVLAGLAGGCGAMVGRGRRARLGRLVGRVDRRHCGAGVGLVVPAVPEVR